MTIEELSEPLIVETNHQHAEENLLAAPTAALSNENDSNNDPINSSSSLSSNTAAPNPWKNHNVRLSLLLCLVCGLADSIWSSVVLSGYLFALGTAMGKSREDNTLVGAAEAVEGLTQLVTALPIGVLADKLGKAKIVRAGGGLMLVTIAITVWALFRIQHQVSNVQAANQAYYILVAALGLWGIVNGVSYGPSQALFADSIPKGQRSELLTWLYSFYLLASTVGPLVGIVLFLTVSADQQDWSLQEIFPVFLVGVLLEIPAAILMFFFSDKHAVQEDNDDEQDDETMPQETGDPQEQCQQSQRQSLSKAAVPYVLFLSSLVVSLGSGASVKYFPLFFKELGLSSAAVQGIFLAVPISISGLSFISQKVSQKLGRIETTVLFDIVGTSLLYFMTWLSQHVETGDYKRTGIIVGVYLLRTGIMNCTYPLLESILMDSVKSNERAKWKSLESIASFGWTGSALVGGILSDEHSYQFTFAITATMQLCGGLLLMLIQPFVEPEQDRPVDDNQSDSAPQGHAQDSLSEPLLSSP